MTSELFYLHDCSHFISSLTYRIQITCNTQAVSSRTPIAYKFPVEIEDLIVEAGKNAAHMDESVYLVTEHLREADESVKVAFKLIVSAISTSHFSAAFNRAPFAHEFEKLSNLSGIFSDVQVNESLIKTITEEDRTNHEVCFLRLKGIRFDELFMR